MRQSKDCYEEIAKKQTLKQYRKEIRALIQKVDEEGKRKDDKKTKKIIIIKTLRKTIPEYLINLQRQRTKLNRQNI
jgi:hypothetical protein